MVTEKEIDKFLFEPIVQEKLHKTHKWSYEKIAERTYESLDRLISW